MSFQTYYQNTFQSHLQEFYNSIPDDMRHHNHQTFYDENKTFTIQVDKLSNHGRGTNIEHLKFLSPEDKIHFSISLLLTILTDQVCYTYFNFDCAFLRYFGFSNTSPSDVIVKSLIPKSIPMVVFSA